MMPRLGAPVQIAYVVPDLTSAARTWVRDVGAGPFFVNEHIELTDVVHRGNPATFDHSSAYGQWGSIMVELVHDHGQGPSVVRDRFGPCESGLHHLAFLVDDLEQTSATLLAGGAEIVLSARTTGGTAFRFIDLPSMRGHLVELYERSDRIADFYAMVASAADSWDGTDPIRFIRTSNA
jgi:catechol 2,3-dioxygenase-like lactoylglutathione lyase family enzyme